MFKNLAILALSVTVAFGAGGAVFTCPVVKNAIKNCGACCVKDCKDCKDCPCATDKKGGCCDGDKCCPDGKCPIEKKDGKVGKKACPCSPYCNCDVNGCICTDGQCKCKNCPGICPCSKTCDCRFGLHKCECEVGKCKCTNCPDKSKKQ